MLGLLRFFNRYTSEFLLIRRAQADSFLLVWPLTYILPYSVYFFGEYLHNVLFGSTLHIFTWKFTVTNFSLFMSGIILSVSHHLTNFEITLQMWFRGLNSRILLCWEKRYYCERNFAELQLWNFLDLHLKGSRAKTYAPLLYSLPRTQSFLTLPLCREQNHAHGTFKSQGPCAIFLYWLCTCMQKL
jgi:hypothetical protein